MDGLDLAGRIGLVGAGAMAEALLSGWVAKGLDPALVKLTNRSNRQRLAYLEKSFGAGSTGDKAELASWADTLVLATKPQDAALAAIQFRGLTRPGQLLVSVVAGLKLRWLEHAFPGVAVIRAMPNTSCRVSESATALAAAHGCSPRQLRAAGAIFAAVGEVTWVDEEMLDAVTGLSGSGPAYVYYLVEAMEEAGARVGLPPEITRRLAVRTVLGAARMLLESGEEPARLRAMVSSPDGTTVAGIKQLEDAGFKEAVIKAVAKATVRATELARE
ncbi:MAG: pyrroline-5-carboxylate reductase [Bacillota bacterium]